jgi:hypothetical protein
MCWVRAALLAIQRPPTSRAFARHSRWGVYYFERRNGGQGQPENLVMRNATTPAKSGKLLSDDLVDDEK